MGDGFVERAMKDYGNVVLRAAFSVVGNKSDAEDVFSDVFFALFKNTTGFNDENHLKAWLIRSAVNKAKNIKTSAWTKNRVSLTDNVFGDNGACDFSFSSELKEAMMSLKQDERAVLYLHYYEGYAFKEIAQMLKAREGSIRSKASRARAALREFLSD